MANLPNKEAETGHAFNKSTSGQAPTQSDPTNSLKGAPRHPLHVTSKKCCHQCRHGEDKLKVACTKMIPYGRGKKAYTKQCVLLYCIDCLDRHYTDGGNKALEMWECPKCRECCTCSNCMRNKGQEPVGRQGKPGRKIGQHGDDVDEEREDPVVASGETSAKKVAEPQGSPVLNLGSIQLPADDVGPAQQFIDFCKALGEVFGMEEDDPEIILEQIFVYDRSGPSGDPLIVSFQKLLIFYIQDDEGKLFSSWLEGFQVLLSRSDYTPEALGLEKAEIGVEDYDNLDGSSKLRILNFLCQEVSKTKAVLQFLSKKKGNKKKRKRGSSAGRVLSWQIEHPNSSRRRISRKPPPPSRSPKP